jgi:drug/metabolite transporter (DMT)-like permease
VLADRQRWWGAGIVAASAILVAIGNVVAARLMDARVGWMTVNAFGMAAGSAAVLVWAVVTGAPWVLEPTATWLAGYLYLVVLGSVVAFGIYMRILPTIGTTAGAYVTVLSPVLALVVSAWLEGLELRPMIYAGVVLLLIGHSLLIRQRARRPRS